MLDIFIKRVEELFASSLQGGSLSFIQLLSLYQKDSYEIDSFLTEKGWERAKDSASEAAWAYNRRSLTDEDSITMGLSNDKSIVTAPAWIKIQDGFGERVLVYDIPSLQRFDIIRRSMLDAGMARISQENIDNQVIDTYFGQIYKVELRVELDAGKFAEANKYVFSIGKH